MNILRAAYNRAYLYSPFRVAVQRYGPAVWRLPKILRRAAVAEARISKLPGVKTAFFGHSQAVQPPRVEHPLPTHGHLIVARPYKLKSHSYSVLPDAWLVGKHATPITPQGKLVLSPFRFAPRLLGLEPHPDLEAFLKFEKWKDRPAAVLRSICSFVNRLDPNYFHWLTELCSQLQSMEHFEHATGIKPKLLVREGGPRFKRESLRLLGIDADRIVEWKDNENPTFVEQLIVPALPGDHTGHSPASLKWLRERFLKSVSAQEKGKAFRQIYIPRKPGTWRHVVNDEEVCSKLAAKGWDIIDPAALSFAEQVKIFSDAVLIAGPHGAGLTNILFAPEAALLEVVSVYGDGSYMNLCHCLKQPYTVLVRPPHGDDMVIDVEQLLSAAEKLVNSPLPVTS